MTSNKMSKINIALDSTMLDMLMLCPARFNYRFNLNKVTPVKAKPLDRGTLVHLGLESYYQTLQSSRNYDMAVMAMKNSADIASVQSSLEPDECRRCQDVLLEYVDFYKSTDLQWNIHAIEQSFMYVLYEDDKVRIHMIGKIDLLISDNSYINLPIDHKSYDRDYPVRRKVNQFCNYAYATQSNYLLVNKIGFQKTLKPVEKYKRIPVSYDKLFLEQWRQNVIKWCFYYLDCVGNDTWPLNDTSCDKWNRLCEYYDICDSSGNDAKRWKLTANFEDAPKWDVSEVLGLKLATENK